MWVGFNYDNVAHTITGWAAKDTVGVGEVLLGGPPPALPTASLYSVDPVTLLITGTVTRVPRGKYDIASDVFTKTTGTLPTPAPGTQKANIIADLFTGNIATGSQKWQQNNGPNSSVATAMYGSNMSNLGQTVFSAAQQLLIAAMYCLDHPTYLVFPSFDPTINIPGDQPA